MNNIFNMNMFIFFMIFVMMMMNLIISYNKNMHPLVMGMILLMMSIINSLNMNIMMDNHWYSFLMYLIIIGGMLILFLYFTSFVMNMKILINFNNMKNMPIKFILFIMMNFIVLIFLMNYNFLFNKYNEINNLFMNFLMNMNYLNNLMTLKYLYNKTMNYITVFIMIYLFFVLTIIVKICLFKKKTIRKLN